MAIVKKWTDSTVHITLKEFKYIVVIFCNQYREGNSKLLTQVRLTYFTLRIRQSLFAKRKSHN